MIQGSNAWRKKFFEKKEEKKKEIETLGHKPKFKTFYIDKIAPKKQVKPLQTNLALIHPPYSPI